MLRLADLLSDIASEHGYYYNDSDDTDIDSDTTNKPRQKYLKRLINNAYQEILGYMPSDFLRTELPILLPAIYSTGTANITQGYVGTDGNGTAWTRYMQMRQMLFSGEKRPYFIKEFSSATALHFAKAYAEATVLTSDYKIGCWAVPLPHNLLAPIGKESVWNADDRVPITLVSRKEFRRMWPTCYSTGKPTFCCIDGMTTFPRRSDTGDVENDSATVVLDNYKPKHEDVGSIVKLAGDSIQYVITDVDVIAGELTVSPVVQRATEEEIAIEIDPAPLPLLWFNHAPTSDLPLILRYIKKPDYLWTDEQRIELYEPFENAMVTYAQYLACQYLSREVMQNQQALGRWQLALSRLPERTDLSIIMKEINRDAKESYYKRTSLSNMYNQATE